MAVWKGRRIVEPQSCRRTEGGVGVVGAELQSGLVAKLQNGRLKNSRVAESQRWGGLQSWGVAELGS